MKKLLLLLITFFAFWVFTTNADTLVTSDLSSSTLYDVYAVQNNSWSWSLFVGRSNTRTLKVFDSSGSLIAEWTAHNQMTCSWLEDNDSSSSFGLLESTLIKYRNGNFVYLFNCRKQSNSWNSTWWGFGYYWNGSVLQAFANRLSTFSWYAFDWHASITENWQLFLRQIYTNSNTWAKFLYWVLSPSWDTLTSSTSTASTWYIALNNSYNVFFENRLYQKTSTWFRQYRYEPSLTSTQFSDIPFQSSSEPFAWNVDLILDLNVDQRLVFSENNITYEYDTFWELSNSYSWALVYWINQDIYTFDSFDFSPDIWGWHYNTILQNGQIRYIKNWDLFIDDDSSSSNFFDISNSWGWTTSTWTTTETWNIIIDNAISPIIDAIFWNSTDFIQFYDINIPTEYENLYFDVPVISLTDWFKFELSTQQTQIPDIRSNALDIKAFERNEDWAKFIVFFLAVTYIISRLILVWMLFYLIFLLSSVLAKIFQKFTWIDSSKVEFSWNIITSVIAWAFFVLYAFALASLYTSVIPLLPMADKISHLLTVFFSTIANTFWEYVYFATIVNSFFLAVTWLIVWYIWMRIAVAFWKLN